MSIEGQPPTRAQEHAQAQRNRILDAAERNFIAHGFHAAGMAGIAESAQMSPGLIYRYFESKNAIILAISERQLQEKQAKLSALQSTRELAVRLCKLFVEWQRQDPGVINPALLLEMSAEATRDSQIAQAILNADRLSQEQGSAWFKRMAEAAGCSLSDEDIAQRLFAVQTFVDGLAVRAVRDPHVDPKLVSESMRLCLRHVLCFEES